MYQFELNGDEEKRKAAAEGKGPAVQLRSACTRVVFGTEQSFDQKLKLEQKLNSAFK